MKRGLVCQEALGHKMCEIYFCRVWDLFRVFLTKSMYINK
jgi:hypothetical protein